MAQPPVDVYHEDFESVPPPPAPQNAVQLNNYTGGPAANSSTYFGSPKWIPSGQQCNGWILRSSTPRNTTVTNVDSGCDTTAWATLQSMGTAIGLYRGETAPVAQTNHILSEYTNGGANPGAGVEFQTAKPLTTGIMPTHFYSVSAIYAAANCVSQGPTLGRGDPLLTFNMIVNQTGDGPPPGSGGGTLEQLASGLNPCTIAGAKVIGAGGINYHVAKLNSASFRADATTTSLGIQLFNAQPNFKGNDSGFDDPSIVDSSPQLDKQFSPTTLNVGQVSNLTFTITNTTDLQAKNGWSFTDTLPAGLTIAGTVTTTCPGSTLTPGATSVTATANLAQGMTSCTVTVPVTSATEGNFTNDSTNVAVDGLWPPGTTTVDFNEPSAPDIEMIKSADLTDPADYVVGATIHYSFDVVNNGSDPLTNVAVTEDSFDGAGTPHPVPSCPATTLAVGARMTCTASYVIIQADVDAGSITNVATASGLAPDGETVTATDDLTISGFDAPAIDLIKVADPSALQTPPQAGDLITYTYAAANTGNETLTNVTINDPHPGLSALTYTWPAATGVLAPGAFVIATATYPITQTDIDAETVLNEATAEGINPDGGTTTSPPVDAEVALTTAPALSLAKSADATDVRSPAVVGDPIHYQFTATNTGNVTLHSVNITDALAGLGPISYTWPGATGVLAPGEAVVAHADYPITQADIDAGGVTNDAVAHSLTPDDVAHDSNHATTTTPLDAVPSIALTKTADESGIHRPAVVGDTIAYTFVVTNDGNVTLEGVDLADQLAGLTTPTFFWSGLVGELAPGASVTATASYSVTQADITAGHVANQATASGVTANGAPAESQPANTDTPLTPGPSLSLVKSASPNDQTSFTVGQLITYSFVVTNVGNVPVTAVSIAEGKFTGSGTLSPATCPGGAPPLAPGEQVVCTATYTLTAADLFAGEVFNDAIAHGTSPTGADVPSNRSEVTIPASAAPAETLVKTADKTNVSAAGDIVHYSFLITNTGNTVLTDVTVKEGSFSGTGTLSAPECPAAAKSLAPGEFVTCTATYTVTSGDLAVTNLTNVATAVGTPPSGTPISSAPSTAVVQVAAPVAPGTTTTTTAPAAAEAATSTQGLAFTGNSSLVVFAAGAALMAVGLAVAGVGRRRRARR
jgi:uncharacterized repeat protein (TIGR01451 family)